MKKVGQKNIYVQETDLPSESDAPSALEINIFNLGIRSQKDSVFITIL